MHAPFVLSRPGPPRLRRWLASLAGQRGSIRGQLVFVVALIAFALAWKAGLVPGVRP
jgi:hypothetical protein